MVVGECARIWQVQSMRQAPGFVIPRSEATWESPAGSCDFADGFPTIRPSTARLPRLLRSLAMTSQGGFPHPEGRNDKPESASLPCHSEERSDVGISSRHYRIRRGFPVFRACTARLPRLLRSLAMTSQGGFPHQEGRNDKAENRCGRREASANPYAISGNCYISQSADKSTHLGFIVAISASFRLRDQLFICFSRSIAALTSGVVSK